MFKVDTRSRQPLFSVEATRALEQAAQASLPPHALMQRAGLAVARLALALAPHARRIWIACGPGNNGGDGLEAAMHLQRWGKQPIVTWLGSLEHAPQDAVASQQRAVAAGVAFAQTAPLDCDLCIDALLGMGATDRSPDARMTEWIKRINEELAPVLAIDLPTGLLADTGALGVHSVRAQHTLSLLTLKPGLFTARGRDAAGSVWLDDLDVACPVATDQPPLAPRAWLSGAPQPKVRPHASHKGSFGDLAVVGGATGMTGAALLAACAALHSGAGRVFVSLLADDTLGVDSGQPELMFRPSETLDFKTMTVVCGCGGGGAVASILPRILSTAARLVLDADALNAIANDTQLQTLLLARGRRRAVTALTPHPLEAARLLGSTASAVQQQRLDCAEQLAQRFGCTVVLKGSGSIIAAPQQTTLINPTGNARLATAGTGDVLAGMIGARLAGGENAFEAAWHAVYQHGRAADQWPGAQPLTAAVLAHCAQPDLQRLD